MLSRVLGLLTSANVVKLYVGAFFLCIIIQGPGLGVQRWFGEKSYWGHHTPAAGWQTEIAIWNAGCIGMLIGVLRAAHAPSHLRDDVSHVLPGLFLLCILFAINHLHAVVSMWDRIGPNTTGIPNIMGLVANCNGIALVTTYYMYTRKPKSELDKVAKATTQVVIKGFDCAQSKQPSVTSDQAASQLSLAELELPPQDMREALLAYKAKVDEIMNRKITECTEKSVGIEVKGKDSATWQAVVENEGARFEALLGL